MKSLKLLFAISSLAFCCAACGSDDKGTTDTQVVSCDPATFTDYCDGDTRKSCLNSKHKVSSTNCANLTDSTTQSPKTCAEFNTAVDLTSECDPEDEACFEEIEETKAKTECVALALECITENETKTECVTATNGATHIYTYTCTKAADGRLFFRKTGSTGCYGYNGICSENGECLPPTPCDESYENHCDGNVAYTCSRDKLSVRKCTSAQTCAMYNGKPSCINTKETCSKEGEQKISSCNSNTNKETIKTCIKSDDGKLFYKQIDSQPCFNGCNDDNSACKAEICPLSEPLEKCRNSGGTTTYIDRFVCKDNANGERVWQLESSEKTDGTCDAKGNFIPKEECSTNDFEAECDGNISVTCSAKVVKRANCEASVTPKVCAVIDNKPGCYAEKDECTAPGTQIVSGCLTNLGKERVVICQKASNGKSYWVFSKNQDCANGCNAAGTACAE